MSVYELIPGTLELLILKAVSLGPLHGYGVLLRIQQLSKDALRVPQGSLYPALHRLETGGWLDTEWGLSENNRRAKFYRLSTAGERQLIAETKRWSSVSEGVDLVLEAETGR